MSLSFLSDEIAILLVDDRPENLLSLEELLSDQGYTLIRAESGNEALRQTLKRDFSLILLDVQMPEMDGFETAELLRMNPKTSHIPIIFVTAGMKNMQFQFKGYDVGAVDYLTKPIEPLFLRSKVKIFADLYAQRHEVELHKNHLQELVALRTVELQKSNQELQRQNHELEATEELLRSQIVEIVETHDRLRTTEVRLREQLEQSAADQKRLAEANRTLQMVFDVLPLALMISSSSEGMVREVNLTFSRVFGYPADQVLGRSGTAIGLWGDEDQPAQFLSQLQGQQSISGFGTQLKTLSGETRSVLIYCNQIDYKDEKCLLTVFLDVTEQKLLEDRIRQTQKMEAIGQLAGGVAHDFNNMLAAILGSAELLARRHLKEDPVGLKRLASIQQAASRSAELTGQMLAFSRKGQHKLEQVCLHVTIHDVVALLERTIDKNITLKIELEGQNTLVSGDRALLQNALLNLGINARDAMPDGGILTFATANLELSAGECTRGDFLLAPGKYIEVLVRDTGIGMTAETQARVFEPFFTTKGVGKGTGLGLAAVYGTIIGHQGGITIGSDLGCGTTFRIYLPLSTVAPVAEIPKDEIIRGTGGVLLVDDEELLRDVGRQMLEELGYQVFVAADGVQALELYRREQQQIAYIILDMVMPKQGGRETLIQLKSLNPAVSVLIASGFHRDGVAAELTQLGACGFLQKPYNISALCQALAGLKH